MTGIPDPIALSCGCYIDCQVIDGVNTLILTACDLGDECKNYQELVHIAQEEGKNPTVINAREDYRP